MNGLRQHVTPFKADGTVITCAAGRPIAVAETEGIAAFLVLAANRYDSLMAMHDLCRGNFELLTAPYRFPADKKFHELSQALLADIDAHGR